jgi:arylsulfatase
MRLADSHSLLSSALLLAGIASCNEPAPPARAPNVVLICLDTVRADHLGTYGYRRATTPTLDALAARSLVFADASATAGWTKPSVPSFLTGTYPSQHGVYEGSAHAEEGAVTDLLPEEALTLAEVFRASGYRTAAFVHNAQLRAGNGFEQGFERYEEANLDAREIRWRSLDWLDRRPEDPRGAPFFLYLHFLDAHWPYPAPEEWITRFAPAETTARFRGRESKALYRAINDGEHLMTDEDRAALIALYDGALAYLDAELGHFLAGLALRGLADDTIVCIVADHGEEFGEHGKVGHGHGLWEPLLRVPWILHVPGSAPERRAAPVSLIDLFPTLLAAAGLAAPAGHEGVNRLAEPDAARPVLAEHKAPDRYFQSLRDGSSKLQRRFTPPVTGPGEELVLPIALGTRWEAELELAGDELVATQLKPRDEAPEDPPELKGRIEALTATSFAIGGITVLYDDASERQTGAGTAGPELADGQVVKVRGEPVGGTVRAERIKFYAPAESEEIEVRGTVEGLDQSGGVGTLTLSGFRLRVTGATNLKGAALVPKNRRLAREAIAELLGGGAGDVAKTRGFEGVRTLFDLARDPGELAGQAVAAGSELDARLDALGRALASRRVFGVKDQRALDAEALQELEAIGYGGGN